MVLRDWPPTGHESRGKYLEWCIDSIFMLKSSLLAFTRIQYDCIIRIGCQEKELYAGDRKLYKHDHFIVRTNNSAMCVWISPYVYGYILLTTRYGADVSGEGEGVLGTTLKHPPSPKSALLTETWYVLMQISQLLAVSLCLSLFLSKSSLLLLLCPPPVSLFLRTNDISRSPLFQYSRTLALRQDIP